MKRECDFVVIGGGSAGYNAASHAAGLGLKTAVIEGGRELGGLCILRGCMPSKTLIESASRFLAIRRAAEFGLKVRDASFDAAAILDRKRRLVGEFAAYRRQQLESGGFELIRGTARFTDPHTIEVKAADGAVSQIEGRTFLLATGSTSSVLDVPGLADTGFLDSDAVLESAVIPRSVIILGGGATALEFAHFYEGLGSNVAIIQRGPQLLTGSDADVACAIADAYRRRGMDVYLKTRLIAVEKGGGVKRVRFEHDGAEKSVDAEEIVYALGRKPNIQGLGLKNANVYLEHGRPAINASQQTSVPHIFAAGDVCGPYEIVHIAIQQGVMSARNAARFLGHLPMPLEETDYRLKLFAVFSHPEIATVGMSESELADEQIPFRAARYPFDDHGKSIIAGETEGFVKLIAHAESGEILGAAVVGPHASELIHEICVAMHFRATVKDLACVPFYHPTLSEIWSYPADELASI